MPRARHLSSGARRSALVAAAIAAAVVVAALGIWVAASGSGGAPDVEGARETDALEETWPQTGLVAAEAGGVEIGEDDVTEEIVELRESLGLESPEAWNEFLDTMGYEPETLREQVITRRVNEALIAEECEARGLGLSDGELDAALEEEKASFESPEAWQAYLENYGMDEAAFRETLRARLLAERLQGALVAQSTDGWDELGEEEREQKVLAGADVLNEWLARKWEAEGIDIRDMPDAVPYGRAS